MPRCEQCNHFVGIELRGEVESVEIEDTTLTAMLRLIKECVECGNELEEYHEEVEEEIEGHHECDGEMPVDQAGAEILEEPDELDMDELGEGTGRYRKTFYIGRCEVGVRCNCGWEGTVPLEASEQASYFDEI